MRLFFSAFAALMVVVLAQFVPIERIEASETIYMELSNDTDIDTTAEIPAIVAERRSLTSDTILKSYEPVDRYAVIASDTRRVQEGAAFRARPLTA